MPVNTALLEAARAARREYPLLPFKTAVEIARYEQRASTEYPFLNDMSSWPDGIEDALIGEVDGITITVALKDDEDSKLGDDDVTGWFTDDYEDGCIKNTVRYHSHGQWGQGYKWYHPARSRQGDGDWQWYSKHNGMSKSVARDFVRDLIEQDMHDDADRSYLMLHVTLAVEGRAIADTWLGGIDVGSDSRKSRSYLIETAEEQIHEAFSEARANIDKKVERAQAQLDALVRVREVLNRRAED